MRSPLRAIFFVLSAAIVSFALVWAGSSRSGGGLDEIASRAREHPSVAIVGDDRLALSLRGVGLAEPHALDEALAGRDEPALLEAIRENGIGSLVVALEPSLEEPADPTIEQRLRRYDAFDELACVVLTPEAALYVPRSEVALEPILAGALGHVARAIVGGASAPRVQSFPEPLRRIRNVEVMVLLSDADRPRLWRSARGSSVARALITAATVARQRWMERESAMGGPLARILPTLDVAVHVLAEDGTLGARAPSFVDRVFRDDHGVAFEHRGNWHYLLPDATRERGGGSAVRAYTALFADQDMPPESLDRPDVRLYRSVARRVAISAAPGRAPPVREPSVIAP